MSWTEKLKIRWKKYKNNLSRDIEADENRKNRDIAEWNKKCRESDKKFEIQMTSPKSFEFPKDSPGPIRRAGAKITKYFRRKK